MVSQNPVCKNLGCAQQCCSKCGTGIVGPTTLTAPICAENNLALCTGMYWVHIYRNIWGQPTNGETRGQLSPRNCADIVARSMFCIPRRAQLHQGPNPLPTQLVGGSSNMPAHHTERSASRFRRAPSAPYRTWRVKTRKTLRRAQEAEACQE